MSWLSPAAFWFLLLLPAVVLLYFLRLRRNDVLISSTLLWSRALEDRRANAPFQKLRNSLLMFLQLLAILIMVGALARPESEVTEVPGLTHILLVDVSSSMLGDEDGQPRLELAKDKVRNYIESIGKSEQGILVRFARSAKALTPVTADRTVLLAAVDDLVARQAATSVDAL